jgi:alkylation response protein AidB-like acyl-CoA dehydrogenase
MERSPATPAVVAAVRRFVDDEVRPVAAALEHDDRYPDGLVARMRALGLFGALVPARWGGLGLDVTTYAQVVEELCRGWMSLAGVINSHTMAALIVLQHGTDEQRDRLLPRFARGDARGGLCLTEPHAGSDVQAIRTVARRYGDHYRITGTKMFVTNGREGNTFALLALTDPTARPPHRGMSCFIVEKGGPGLSVVKSISKLGYKGVDTAELLFEDFVVSAANLVGGVEGRGFRQVMGGLETGRINIAARAVGVARAACDAALAEARVAGASASALADMATRTEAAQLLTYWAAGMKDRGERCDLEAGMAKLYASETAQQVADAAVRLRGELGTSAALDLERYLRDTPLMIIGEGTNEIQRTIIARHLVARYGERHGALVARDDEPEERRHMVLTVRQLVDKAVVPVAADLDRAARFPDDAFAQLADLGVLAALVPAEDGGLGVDPGTCAMLLEELARGSLTLAAAVAGHLAVTRGLAAAGGARLRERLPALGRGELVGACALGGAVDARRDGEGWALEGRTALVDNAPRAGVFLVEAAAGGGRRICAVVGRDAAGLAFGAPAPLLGARGLDPAPLTLRTVRVGPADVLGAGGDEEGVAADVRAFVRLAVAAAAVGLGQAAFEAALRYAQQRVTFGRPIAQHQAIQLKLADMATALTAARLLTARAGRDGAPRTAAIMAKVQATEAAWSVGLEAMRVHGGYGYTTEFPVERYYRDAARLLLIPDSNDGDRAELARALVAG